MGSLPWRVKMYVEDHKVIVTMTLEDLREAIYRSTDRNLEIDTLEIEDATVDRDGDLVIVFVKKE
jgi:hypothetical protein